MLLFIGLSTIAIGNWVLPDTSFSQMVSGSWLRYTLAAILGYTFGVMHLNQRVVASRRQKEGRNHGGRAGR